MKDLLHVLDESSIISTADASGIINYANDKFCEISQYSKEELIGQNHRIVNSGYHSHDFFKKLWKMIASSRVWKGEIKNKAKDGSFYWVFTTIIPLLDSNGKVREYVSIRYDITEKKRIEEEVSRINEENLRSKVNQTASETFISILTHDLRTPLTSAKMSAQLIERNLNKPDIIKKMITRVLSNINRADDMITDLLNATKIRAGQNIMLELTDCDGDEISRKTIDELSEIYGPRFNLVKHGQCRGQWSASGIKRIIENLCSNAVKYGQVDSMITLTMTAFKDHFEISVHNFGEILPQEEIKYLFDYMQRSVSAQNGDKKGWGIGLTLVKGMVEAHGGVVDVRSLFEEGTTFKVTLPNEYSNKCCMLC